MARHWMFTLFVLMGSLVVADASSHVMAEEGDWLVRMRLLLIEPDAEADGTLGDLQVDVEPDITVEVDATYFITNSFAIEGILATASQEVVYPVTSTTFGAPVGSEVSLGSITHAPATFLAQYHFKPDGKIRPYIGAGLNITLFYGESGTLQDLETDSSSVGPAVQVGSDFMITDTISFNLDLKYIQIENEVLSGGVSLGTVDINPYVLGFGLGARF